MSSEPYSPITSTTDSDDNQKGKIESLETQSSIQQETWMNIVCQKDVNSIRQSQVQTSRKFEETNEMLHQFNILSEATFIELQSCFKKHEQVLKNLNTNLNGIFRRLRVLNEKLKNKYPESYKATSPAIEKWKERTEAELEKDPI